MSDAEQAGQVYRLLYCSRSRIPEDHRKVELGKLFTSARSSNKQGHITGALLVTDGRFVQVLEGDEAPVRKLFARISGDPRHAEVSLIESGTVDHRVFGRWAMAQVSEAGEADIPLIAHADGISPAAGRGTTPEQDQLLAQMRSVARDESSVG